MIKVVLDTNVLISALLWEGLPNRLLTLIKQGKIGLHTSAEIVDELEVVLGREKFESRIKELKTSVEELTSSILVLAAVYPTGEFPKVIEKDSDDNMLLACAFYSGAEYVISGDKHLLDLGSYGDVKVLSPREFFEEVVATFRLSHNATI